MELEMRKLYLNNKKVDSIYFGGGTPSILTKSEIKCILDTTYNNYNIKEKAEITLECNPDDLNEQKLNNLKEIGINRLSIGVQSFNDDELKFMNRSHNGEEAFTCINLAKKIGFNNITIDLIYGLPKQSLSNWKENLEITFGLDIQHISAYSLTVEDKTMLNYLVKKNKLKPLSDAKTINQFKLLQENAKNNGFIHYEISNFGKEGYFSRHNTAYWQDKHYLGIGPSAHSYNGESRSWNLSSNKKYIQKILDGEDYFEAEKLTKKQQYNEYIFTSLRTIWGLNTETIKLHFGKEMQTHFLKEVQKWKSKKQIDKTQNTYTLTNSGKFIADTIASDLFMV